jgi:hypothetical protein
METLYTVKDELILEPSSTLFYTEEEMILEDERIVRERAHSVITDRDLNLEADGCDFVEAVNFYLTQLGCPENARRFVCCVVGYSGGISEAIEICDSQLAKRAGCSAKSIQRWRKSLVRWELQKKAPVLEIFEGNYDRKEKKNKPTRYRVLITKLAADIVRSARNSFTWTHDSRSAIEQAAKAMSSTVKANSGLIHRRNTRRASLNSLIEGRRKAALTHLTKICYLHTAGYHYRNDDFIRQTVNEFWEGFRDEAEMVVVEILDRLAPQKEKQGVDLSGGHDALNDTYSDQRIESVA